MPDDLEPQEPSLVDESVPEEGASPDAIDTGGPQTQAPPDPYDSRFAQLERANEDLRRKLESIASRGDPRAQSGLPKVLTAPDSQWQPKDLTEYIDWQTEQRAQQAAENNLMVGRLSREALGEGNDYHSVVGRYLAPHVRDNPEIAPLVKMLPAADQYMLGLMRMLYDRSKGDLVTTIKGLLNAGQARQAGAQDVVRSISAGQRRTARTVFQGGGGAQSGGRGLSADEVKDMSWDDFRKLARRASGGN